MTSNPAPGYHIPVLGPETVEHFRDVPPGVIVDATFGGGGHTRLLLEARSDVTVIGLDRDRDAAAQVPDDPRVRFVTANFGDLADVLDRLGITEPDDERHTPLVGVVFDLGVSSHQLDTAERGFSYRAAGPLDMRMGHDAELTAADVVNEWDQRDIARILRRYAEERHAGRIAAAIVANRPHVDTAVLAATIAAAVPAAARRHRHPARRTFQAIRIAINEELTALEQGLEAAIAHAAPGGRIAVISYHSLEDRIVKRRFAAGAKACTCPPELPVCVCDQTSELRIITRRPIRPSDAEVEQNNRARSARLRVAEKVAS